MKNETSKKAVLLRSLLLLPLLALMLYGFSETKLVEKTNPELQKELKEEINRINKLQVKYYSPNGATQRMMSEYENFIIEYEETNTVNYEAYQRAIAIYNLMTDEQKKSVKKYPEFPSLNGITVTEVKQLNSTKFETYKDKKDYAVWVDSKVVDNKQLDKFKASDFVYHTESFVYNNARSKKFPQKYQVSLYTKEGFEQTFNSKEANGTELAKFNVLAEKYNPIPIEKRVIPLKDLKILESIYRKMSSKQKEKAQPFPECLPKNVQKGASREQMAKYNALAKKYNEMDRDEMRILMKDVEQLKYIYSLMSDKQKADAEPFPDFPEPSPAPETPIYLSNKNTIIEVIEPTTPPSPIVLKGEKSNIPAPPNLTLEDIKKQKKDPKTGFIEVNGQTLYYTSKESEITYYNRWGQKVDRNGSIIDPEQTNAEDIIEGQVISKVYKDDKVVAEFNNDNVTISPPQPPLPPEPLEPLDHIIEMAKKGATFCFEDKEISSEKAIELIKKNKSLNISTSKSNSKKTKVKITKAPITN